MKLNHFQQAEINSHKDAEMSYIIQSEIELFRKEPSNFKDGRFNQFALYRKVGKAIMELVSEREGFSDKYHMLTEKEAANYLWESYKEKYPDVSKFKWKNWEDLIYPFIDSLIYASLLKARVPLKEYYPTETYWPFGQDGGFCNPMKLKMMEES